jgi:predicted MPP superfamily phosphohydrolase
LFHSSSCALEHENLLWKEKEKLGRFITFILAYLSIYGGVHLYAYFKLRKGMTPGPLVGWLLALFMSAMVAAPIVTRIVEHYGHENTARIIAYIGYVWMGLVFVFVTTSFFIDTYRAVLGLARLITQKDLFALIPSYGFSCSIAVFLAIAVTIYGSFEARQIRLEHIVIPSAKISKDTKPIRIVQISDIHLGIIMGRHRLDRILEKVREAKPDILVSTGDLVDGQMDNLEALAEMIREIRTPHGKFAVTGNHEFYAGIARSLNFTEKAGFKVLRGEGVSLPNGINMVGIDDPARPYRELGNDFEKGLLLKFPRDSFTVYLKHQPVIAGDTSGLFDLQLSGHTHKGQIFPFNLATRLFYKIHPGLTRMKDKSWVYVSRGSGTWGPPIRFLAPPEVTLIELVHGRQAASKEAS